MKIILPILQGLLASGHYTSSDREYEQSDYLTCRSSKLPLAVVAAVDMADILIKDVSSWADSRIEVELEIEANGADTNKNKDIQNKTNQQSFDLFRLSKSKSVVDVCSNTLRAYFKEGLPHYKQGKAVFVSKSELAAFIVGSAH